MANLWRMLLHEDARAHILDALVEDAKTAATPMARAEACGALRAMAEVSRADHDDMRAIDNKHGTLKIATLVELYRVLLRMGNDDDDVTARIRYEMKRAPSYGRQGSPLDPFLYRALALEERDLFAEPTERLLTRLAPGASMTPGVLDYLAGLVCANPTWAERYAHVDTILARSYVYGIQWDTLRRLVLQCLASDDVGMMWHLITKMYADDRARVNAGSTFQNWRNTAIANGRVQCLECLLDRVPILSLDADTMLSEAIDTNRIPVVAMLHARFPDVPLDPAGAVVCQTLRYDGGIAMADWLLAHGATMPTVAQLGEFFDSPRFTSALGDQLPSLWNWLVAHHVPYSSSTLWRAARTMTSYVRKAVVHWLVVTRGHVDEAREHLELAIRSSHTEWDFVTLLIRDHGLRPSPSFVCQLVAQWLEDQRSTAHTGRSRLTDGLAESLQYVCDHGFVRGVNGQLCVRAARLCNFRTFQLLQQAGAVMDRQTPLLADVYVGEQRLLGRFSSAALEILPCPPMRRTADASEERTPVFDALVAMQYPMFVVDWCTLVEYNLLPAIQCLAAAGYFPTHEVPFRTLMRLPSLAPEMNAWLAHHDGRQ